MKKYLLLILLSSASLVKAQTYNLQIGDPADGGVLAEFPNNGQAIFRPYGTLGGNTGGIRLFELLANGTNYAGFKSSDALAANLMWTLPAVDGANGATLTTNGTGTLTWVGGSGTGTSGFWNRTGTTLSPLNAGDAITTTGNISTTGSGTLSIAGTSAHSGASTFGSTVTITPFTTAGVVLNAAGGLLSSTAGPLPTINGGMGANMTAGAIGAIPYSTSTTAYGSLPAVATGSFLTSAGVGVAPAWTIPSTTTVGFNSWTKATTATTAAIKTDNQYVTGNVGLGDFSASSPAAKLDVTGDVYIKGATGINQHSGSYTTSAGGIKELFRVASSGLCTGGTFTISGTRGGFVHTTQWAWSSTHNGTGKGVLTQLSSGEYSNITVYLDVAGDGSVIISADWGAAETYAISIQKTAGAALNLASVYTDWTTVSGGYTRVRTVTTISNGFQTQDAVFNGFVGIGTGVSGTYRLNVSGKLKTDGIDENSDARLKKNINPIYDALGKVTQMRGVTYNWRKDEFPERNMESDLQYGLIAQELETIIPELVSTDDKGYKAIEYSHLVPVLIEAIKELEAKNNAQQTTINSQQQTNSELKASIESLLIRMNALENNVENKTNKAEK